MCVRPGHWVSCSVCATAHRVAQKTPELLQQQMRCIKCGTLKTQNHFARVHAVTPWCRQCELRSDFEYIDCQQCRKRKLRREFPAETRHRTEDESTGELILCLQCSLADETYKCTVCEVEKNRRGFPQRTHLSHRVADMRAAPSATRVLLAAKLRKTPGISLQIPDFVAHATDRHRRKRAPSVRRRKAQYTSGSITEKMRKGRVGKPVVTRATHA